MSQDFTTNSKKPKRVTRAQRNRPVLVTSLATEQQEQLLEEMPTPEAEPIEPITLVDTPPTPRGRIGGFFSTVGKSDQAKEINEADIAKARLARAAHSKATTGKTPVKEIPEIENKPVASKAAATTTRPGQAQRPPSLFKPRYILGMVIYLAAANFLGTIERNFLTSLGVEHPLTQFNLFGLSIQVTPSGLTFIATLIIILVLLVRFDLLPTSLGGAQAGRRAATARNTNSRQASGGDGPKPLPPVIKPGVQGADDDLYRAYRTNQRRDKKR